MVESKTVKKVETTEETRSKTFKSVYVQSWAQSSFPKEVRILIYNLRLATPLKADVIRLEPVAECELVFTRYAFKEYAKFIKNLEIWLDKHQPDEVETYLTQIPAEKHLERWMSGA
jgi:hypothetical protein